MSQKYKLNRCAKGHRWAARGTRTPTCPQCRREKCATIRKAIMFWRPPWSKSLKEIAELLRCAGVKVSNKAVEYHYERMRDAFRIKGTYDHHGS